MHSSHFHCNSRRRLGFSLCGLLFLLSAGCMVGPDYRSPQAMVPDAWHQALEDGEMVGAAELDDWWTLFNDPLLNELIDCADSNNLDLQAAYTRVSQARAQRCVVASAKWPLWDVTRSYSTNRQNLAGLGIGSAAGGIQGFAFDVWTRQLNLSWELDLFGRIHRQIEAADATVGVQIEAYRDVLVSLYGEVAQNYVQVRTLQKQLEYALQNVDIQEKALDLTRRRVEGGISPNLDQFEAESTLASTESEIPPLQVQLHQALNRLAVLIGHYPGSLHERLAKVEPIPKVPDQLPLVIPCDVVRQRPDIRQAERLIASRTAEIGVAISDLYPRFSLTGNIGLQAPQLSDLFGSNSWVYGFGPSFNWVVFQTGRIRCNIARTEATVEEAIALYEQTLLLASEEIENAIIGFNKERVRREALERTVDASQKQLESGLALYREGKTDFQSVLISQTTLAANQNRLAISEGEIINQLVTLYRALGGGWDPADHLPERTVRVHCPQRTDPDVVEDIPVDDVSERYFELAPAEVEDADTTGEDLDFPELGEEQPEPLELPPPRRLPQPDDDFFDRTLREFEGRNESLRESPDTP